MIDEWRYGAVHKLRKQILAAIVSGQFTVLFLNLAKFHIFIPKRAYGGSAGLGIIPKKNIFLLLP